MFWYPFSGSFGDIFFGENLDSHDKVAIKLERSNDRSAQLYNERKFYLIIGSITGFPKMFWFGQWENYNAIVIELLGKNLEDVFEACDNNFSLKTIVLVAIQLLDRFDYLHSKRFVWVLLIGTV